MIVHHRPVSGYRCSDCIYFVRPGEWCECPDDPRYEIKVLPNEGECRRNGPMTQGGIREDGAYYITRWTIVKDGDWCGEFKVIPAQAPKVKISCMNLW